MAIKAVKTLIRLHKRELDELRRQLTALQAQKSDLQQASVKLDEELRDETERAAGMPEMAAFMGNFAARIRRRKEEIAREVQKLDTVIDTLTEGIRIKFGELKKYEIVRDNWLAKEREAANRKESNQMDEVAIQQFIRKEKAD